MSEKQHVLYVLRSISPRGSGTSRNETGLEQVKRTPKSCDVVDMGLILNYREKK